MARPADTCSVSLTRQSGKWITLSQKTCAAEVRHVQVPQANQPDPTVAARWQAGQRPDNRRQQRGPPRIRCARKIFLSRQQRWTAWHLGAYASVAISPCLCGGWALQIRPVSGTPRDVGGRVSFKSGRRMNTVSSAILRSKALGTAAAGGCPQHNSFTQRFAISIAPSWTWISPPMEIGDRPVDRRLSLRPESIGFATPARATSPHAGDQSPRPGSCSSSRPLRTLTKGREQQRSLS